LVQDAAAQFAMRRMLGLESRAVEQHVAAAADEQIGVGRDVRIGGVLRRPLPEVRLELLQAAAVDVNRRRLLHDSSRASR
jgi:hypothetical protein